MPTFRAAPTVRALDHRGVDSVTGQELDHAAAGVHHYHFDWRHLCKQGADRIDRDRRVHGK
jgi:hypothetical protein